MGPTRAVLPSTLSTTKERDMRADVARAIVQQGWQLLELRAVRLSLEEVFVQLVTEEGRPMRSIYAIFKREVAYFTLPIAYVMMGGPCLSSGGYTICPSAGS